MAEGGSGVTETRVRQDICGRGLREAWRMMCFVISKIEEQLPQIKNWHLLRSQRVASVHVRSRR